MTNTELVARHLELLDVEKSTEEVLLMWKNYKQLF